MYLDMRLKRIDYGENFELILYTFHMIGDCNRIRSMVVFGEGSTDEGRGDDKCYA